jgi:hypothetical protein
VKQTAGRTDSTKSHLALKRQSGADAASRPPRHLNHPGKTPIPAPLFERESR